MHRCNCRTTRGLSGQSSATYPTAGSLLPVACTVTDKDMVHRKVPFTSSCFSSPTESSLYTMAPSSLNKVSSIYFFPRTETLLIIGNLLDMPTGRPNIRLVLLIQGHSYCCRLRYRDYLCQHWYIDCGSDPLYSIG